MNRRTPIAAALLTIFAAPFTTFAADAVDAAPATTVAAASTAADQTTLPAVLVNADRNSFAPGAISLSKLPADLHDVAQSVTVVNKALMQSQGAISMADALRNVSGVTLGGAEGGQIGNNINLNGFSARTDVYLDGFRDRAQYYRDTFALDSVEVLMGPSSMLFGRGSTGGAINQVTKKPQLKDVTEIGTAVTSNGLVRATTDVNRALSDTSAVRVEAMLQDGAATTRDQSNLEDFGIAPSIKFGIGTPTEITLSALLQRNRDQPDYGLGPLNGHPVNVRRDQAYGYTNDQTESYIGALNATVVHKLTPDATLRDQIQFNHVRTQAVESSPQTLGTINAAGAFVALPVAGVSNLPLSSLYERIQSHDRNISDTSIYNQTEFLDKLTTGSIKHELLAGLELGHDSYGNQAYYRNGSCNGKPLNAAGTTSGYISCVPVLNPRNGLAPTYAPSMAANLAGGSANTAAVYLNDTMALTPEFKLAGGLRYDRYNASITNTFNSKTIAGSTALPYAQQSLGFTSVRLGGIWQPNYEQSYYLSYGTSFNPSLEQLTGTTGQQNLDPEKNRSYELGGKWDVAHDTLDLSAAVFQITKENARSLISPGIYELEGTVRVNGFRAGATGHVTKALQVAISYSYLDAQITGASAADGTQGKTPANTPKHTLSAWTTYELSHNWEIGGGPVMMSQRYAANTNAVQVSGYARWDATIAYKQPKYDIRLNVFNLADKMYYDALIPSDGGRSVPGIGRSAMLSFNYHM
ncbi:TonB-dependent siderophore receptor [Rugamonas sp.]|uniref:TonB-dependent receptor n=1 Tax=Rugamonas sp. TaxID=1926287 RepID=UPI0025F1A373|nr:TonB-dependent siderophore receptor [Rugamonas sp.]